MSEQLSVDPIACTGHGLCAELFPERIALDDWGYPIIDRTAIPPELSEHALRAVRACPTIALRWAASREPVRPLTRIARARRTRRAE